MSNGHQGEVFVYIGSYTRKSEIGIHLYSFNLTNGSYRYLQGYSELVNPSFLAVDPKHYKLYAVSETKEYNGTNGGSVASYDIDSSTGRLTYLNQQPTYGGAPCYVSLDRSERCLFTANYTGGSVILFPLLENGSIGTPSEIIKHSGSSIHPIRQTSSHVHSVMPDPLNKFIIVADLGIDKLFSYEFDSNELRLLLKSETSLTAGSGPRHFVFHPTQNYVYLINELDSTITALIYDQKNGAFHPAQTVSTLSADFNGNNSCADIHLSGDGQFLYASNRGENTIVIYRVNESDGALHFMERVSTVGTTPRNFAFSPDGSYLLVANQDSDNVCIFSRDCLTGRVQKMGSITGVSQPACIKIASFK